MNQKHSMKEVLEFSASLMRLKALRKPTIVKVPKIKRRRGKSISKKSQRNYYKTNLIYIYKYMVPHFIR